MRLLGLPGVHRPVSDTWMLADALRREQLSGATVADLCTGTGALAIEAKRAGAATVYAIDVSRRALQSTRLNAHRARCRLSIHRGDLLAPLAGMCVDVIVSNPPYIPAATDRLPRHRRATALDGGCDGRALLDRICREAPGHLRPGGRLLLVHSSVCGVDRTCELMRRQGLRPEVIVRRRGPLGPVLTARARMLRERSLLGCEDLEEIVVIRGVSQNPAARTASVAVERAAPV